MSGVGNVGRKHLKWHPSHRFFPNDDILECDNCGCRSYNKEAKVRCTGTFPVGVKHASS